MFSIGDVVVYKNLGVCRVESIETPGFITTGDIYYKLQPVGTMGNVVYVKKENEEQLRYTITKEQVQEYIDRFTSLEGIYNPESRSREREFIAILKEKNWIDCLKMYKGIYEVKIKRGKEGKGLNANDERSFNKVDKIICGEFSTAMGVSVQDIRDQLILE